MGNPRNERIQIQLGRYGPCWITLALLLSASKGGCAEKHTSLANHIILTQISPIHHLHMCSAWKTSAGKVGHARSRSWMLAVLDLLQSIEVISRSGIWSAKVIINSWMAFRSDFALSRSARKENLKPSRYRLLGDWIRSLHAVRSLPIVSKLVSTHYCVEALVCLWHSRPWDVHPEAPLMPPFPHGAVTPPVWIFKQDLPPSAHKDAVLIQH